MSSLNINIKGLRETLQKIEAYSVKIADDIDNELSTAVKNVRDQARVRAPKGKSGLLAASINADTSVRFRKSVGSPLYHAPFVEFGTGSQVFKNKIGFVFTPEMRVFAMEFYITGLGRMPASPYLFPSYEGEKPKLLNRIKEVLFKPTTA